MVEALWAVDFSTQIGAFGSGVAVLETNRIFGGDSNYYYLGDYAIDGKTVRGTVAVIHYSGPADKRIWPNRDTFAGIRRPNIR